MGRHSAGDGEPSHVRKGGIKDGPTTSDLPVIRDRSWLAQRLRPDLDAINPGVRDTVDTDEWLRGLSRDAPPSTHVDPEGEPARWMWLVERNSDRFALDAYLIAGQTRQRGWVTMAEGWSSVDYASMAEEQEPGPDGIADEGLRHRLAASIAADDVIDEWLNWNGVSGFERRYYRIWVRGVNDQAWIAIAEGEA